MPCEARNNAITLANKGLPRDPRGPYRDWEDEVYVGIVYEAMKEEGGLQGAWCEKKRSIQGLFYAHARQNVEPGTYQSLYHAIKGCREPGCEKLHVIRYFCLSHARKNLESRVYEELTRSFKLCKYSDCKNKMGKEGRGGFCKVHRAQLSSTMGSVHDGEKHANANETMSGERTATRKGSNNSDDESTVATASNSLRAPMDTSNGGEYPNEEEEKDEVALGKEDRQCGGFMRGKREEHAQDEVNKATH